jgi:prolyl oligopeptidase
VIEGAKYAGPTWTPDNKGFYYEWLPKEPGVSVADRPGRTELRYHEVGADPKEDAAIFPATLDPKTFLYGGVTRDGRWLFVGVQRGWTRNDLYVRDARKKPAPVHLLSPEDNAKLSTEQRVGHYVKELGFTPLVEGVDAIFRLSWWDGAFYIRTNHQAPNYRVLRAKPGQLKLESWQEIVPESDAKLDDSAIVGGRLALSYLRNASSQIEIRSLEGKHLSNVELPGIGTTSGIVGEPDKDEAYYSFSSFTVPNQIYETSIQKGGQKLWAEVEIPVDTSTMQVDQEWYTSKDGTKVSMFVVHQRGIPLDGRHATLLYGYGGFNIDMTPAFSALAAVWLEHGGVYAVPNLRGGGEYGEAWHRAGMGKNKQNVFDDFIAAGEHLISRGYTRKDKLGIYGGSNGGLLVGAAMTQRPDLFRAVVCAVPLLDMVRYAEFGSGQTWVAEYGSPDNPEEFAALYAYSPYHHVKQGTKYPALLMMAADSDDRVDPMHARKFTAMVQWAKPGLDRPALFRVEDKAGHGGGDMVKKRVASSADITAFLLDQLGGRRQGSEAP